MGFGPVKRAMQIYKQEIFLEKTVFRYCQSLNATD